MAGIGEDAGIDLWLITFGDFHPHRVHIFGQLFGAQIPGTADISKAEAGTARPNLPVLKPYILVFALQQMGGNAPDAAREFLRGPRYRTACHDHPARGISTRRIGCGSGVTQRHPHLIIVNAQFLYCNLRQCCFKPLTNCVNARPDFQTAIRC